MNNRSAWFMCFALALGCGDDGGTVDSGGTAADSGTAGDGGSGADGASANGTTGMMGGDDGGGGTTTGVTDDGDTGPLPTDGGMDVSTGGSDDSSVDTGGSTGGTGVSGHSVSGQVSRSVPPGPGQDAIGDLYLGLLPMCDQNATPIASTVVMNADLSMNGSTIPYTIDNVPDGTWYLVGFLDDNGDADPMNTTADMGDLAAAMGLGPACTQADVNGADITGINLTLNIVVPF